MNRARLAGIPLPAFGPVGWSCTAGTRPHLRAFEMGRGDAEAIAKTGGEALELELAPDGRPALVVKRLCFVCLAPGSRPDTRRVVIADRRWLWGRLMVVRDYNVRRRSGDTRLVGEGVVRVENQTPAPDVVYAAWSLKDKRTAWTVAQVLEDVLGALGGGEIPPALKRTIEIEDLFLNDPGAVALEKALAFAAGYSIRINAEGQAVVFDTRDRGEIAAIAGAGTPLRAGASFHAVSDRSWQRPSKVRVLFDRESELRFDYIEGESLWTAERNNPDPPRRLENVLPVPDVSIVVAGKTCSRGTWVNIDDYLAAIAGSESETAGAARGPLTHAVIRQSWLSAWDYLVRNLYGVYPSGSDHPVWLRRLAAIRKHWRQTFRPLKQWREKLRSLKAYRVAVLVDELGARAPSEAYMDYVARPSRAGLFLSVAKNPDLGRQVSGWAELLANGSPAPAEVRVIDEEAGVFEVRLRPDPWGEVEALAPGNVEFLPKRKVTGNLRDASGLAYGWWATLPLLATFKLAVVLTAMQAAPNSEARMHVEEVEAADAAAILGQPLGACKGTPWTVAVGGGLETARTMWLDQHGTQIDQAFFNGAPFPPQTLVNGANLRARARAEAARLYATMLDREEGGVVVAWNPRVVPAGSISSVDHAIDEKGRALTSIAIYPELEPVNGMAFLPASVQRIVRRLVQP